MTLTMTRMHVERRLHFLLLSGTLYGSSSHIIGPDRSPYLPKYHNWILWCCRQFLENWKWWRLDQEKTKSSRQRANSKRQISRDCTFKILKAFTASALVLGKKVARGHRVFIRDPVRSVF